jgi:FlaA1/EpsC-like NDP-sugar epimerase
VTARRLHIVALALLEAEAFLFVPYLAAVIRAGSIAAVEAKYGPLWPTAVALAIVLLTCMLAMGLYSTRLQLNYFGVLLRIAASVLAATVLMVLFFYLFERLYIGRLLLATTASLDFTAAALIRLVFSAYVDEDGFKQERAR